MVWLPWAWAPRFRLSHETSGGSSRCVPSTCEASRNLQKLSVCSAPECVGIGVGSRVRLRGPLYPKEILKKRKKGWKGGNVRGREGLFNFYDFNCGKIYHLKVYSLVVLDIFRLLYNQYLQFFHFCKTQTQNPLKNNSTFLPSPGSKPPAFSFHELGCSRYLMSVESHSICLFVTGLFPIAECPQGSSTL